MEWKEIEKLLDKIYNGQEIGEQIEGQFLDVKRYPKTEQELIHICRYMAVCFANADGGSLVIGVENNVKGPPAFTGCQDIDLLHLQKTIRDGTKPAAPINLSCHQYKGYNLIEMKVMAGPYEGSHCLTDGSQSKRIGAECQPIYPTAISPKFIHAERLDYSRAVINEIGFDDLSKEEIQNIRKIILISETATDFLHLNDLDLLNTLGMINKKKDGTIEVTVAGLLFAGKIEIIKRYLPYSEIIFVSYDDKEQEEAESRYESGLLSMVLNLQELFMKQYNPVHHLDTGLLEIKIPKIPEQVLREALLNAVTHRDYNNQSSIFFRNYSDRIELVNPGGFINNITPNNILVHNPAWRNRLIAEIFQRMGLVRRAGLGVRRMYRYLMNFGKEPPVYFEEGNEIRLTIFNRVDNDIATFLTNMEHKKESLPLDEMIIISKLKSLGGINTEEASVATQRSIDDVKAVFARMCYQGKLERHGTGRGTYYRFTSNLYSALGNPTGYFRNGDIEKRRQKELVLKFLKDRGKIKNKQVQDLLKTDRSHAYQLLKEIQKNNDIKLIGNGRGSHYELFNSQ